MIRERMPVTILNTIIVEPFGHDYHAYLESNESYYGTGRTADEAIGNLVRLLSESQQHEYDDEKGNLS